MKNLKVSSLFHWLYGAVMFLPILLLPVFMIYSHRHTIDSGTLEVPQSKVVDFNQLYHSQNYNADYVVTTFDNDIERSVSIGDNSSYQYFNSAPRIDVFENHIYSLRVYIYENNADLPNQFALLNTNIGISLTGLGLNSGIATSTSTINSSVGFVFADLFSCDFTYNANIFDLTQMFGAGNEPTLNQFNQWYNDNYYSYILSRTELLKDYSTITYNDTDIMSQATYQLYNATDKYFNISQFFGFENLWDYMLLYWFGGNVTIYLRIFWQLLTYWLVVSIAWLIFDLFMYVPKLAHRWLDRSAIE